MGKRRATPDVRERFGTAVRKPARDTMLAHAAGRIGVGKAFGLHEALDQAGALLGPLLVAAMVAVSGYRLGFAVLAVPAALALAAITWVRRAVPEPERYEADVRPREGMGREALPGRFWTYSLFTALTMLGFDTGDPRPPLRPAPVTVRNGLRTQLTQLGLLAEEPAPL